MSDVKSLGVVGAGQMGAGIAQVAAQVGIDVVVTDIARAQLDGAKAGIAKRLQRVVDKGKLTAEDAAAAAGRIRYATDMEALSGCDFIVEAVTEHPDLKAKVWQGIVAVAREDAIAASNTSSISITKLAAATGRADRFIGMHFMNPVPVMRLIEVIRGLETSEATFAATKALGERMGKTIVCSRDFPGFIVNRVLIPMINEAIFALYEGIASPEDIDAAMQLGTNQPMGPLTLADFIGLDTVLAIAEVLHQGLGDPKYRPCPLLKQYVAAGRLGKKSGRGFFDYTR
jgi:3-hydroxybutyryl-CoA dehydrogenase